MTTPVEPQPDPVVDGDQRRDTFAEPEPPKQAPDPPTPAPWFRRGRVLAIAAGAVVLVLGAVAAVVLLAGSDDPAAGQKTITITGTMTLDRGDFEWGVNSTTDLRCYGRRGYDDIRGGAQVTVTDPNGKVIALGKLDEGKATVGSDQRATECVFPFKVDGVPASHGFYGVEVSHRGVLRYSEADIQSKKLEFTLG